MPDMILLEAEEQMENRVKLLKHELGKVRTGRANPKILDDIRVEYYGAMTPLNQIGKISVPEPSQLLVKPFDKGITKEMEKAIDAANLGIHPQNEGDQIRMVFPALTTERRKEYSKHAKTLGEEAKIGIRKYRHEANDAIKKLEKDHAISEDDSKGYQVDVQELTDKYIVKIDEAVKDKETEIMSI